MSGDLAFVIFAPIVVVTCTLFFYLDRRYDKEHGTGAFIDMLVCYCGTIFIGLGLVCFAVLLMCSLLRTLGIIPT